MRPWMWRRAEGSPPPALVDGLRHEPAPALLATLCWRRNVDDPAAARALLSPTLSHGLRGPDAVAGLVAVAGRVAEHHRAGHPLGVHAAAEPAAMIAAAVLEDGFGELGVPIVRATHGGATLAIDERGLISAGSGSIGAVGGGDRGPALVLAPAAAAFYLVAATRRLLPSDATPRVDLRRLLDLTALGVAVADVPLVAEHRTLLALGLPALAASRRPGLRAVLELAGTPSPTARAVATRLRPRLAAAARAGTGDVLALLTGRDPEEAARRAARLEIAAAAEAVAARCDIDGARLGAGEGVTVLTASAATWEARRVVATRLAARLSRPVVVVGRAGTDVAIALEQPPGTAAAGTDGASSTAVAPLRVPAACADAAIADVIRGVLGREVWPLFVDAELSIAGATPATARAIARLEPFGAAMPEPVLVARDVRVDAVSPVGDPAWPRWRLRLRQEHRTRIATSTTRDAGSLRRGMHVEVAYVLRPAPDGSDVPEIEVLDTHPSAEPQE